MITHKYYLFPSQQVSYFSISDHISSNHLENIDLTSMKTLEDVIRVSPTVKSIKLF